VADWRGEARDAGSPHQDDTPRDPYQFDISQALIFTSLIVFCD
jgi:hypothetical protein